MGDTAFFGIDLLTPLDTLGEVVAFFLGHGGEHGQNKLTFSHGIHIGSQEDCVDAHGFELTDTDQKIDGISSQAADIFYNNCLEEPTPGIAHQAIELIALFQ